MEDIISKFILCILFLYFIDGIYTSFCQKVNKYYILGRVIFPLVGVISMIYLIVEHTW